MTGSSAAIQVRQGRLTVKELQLDGPGWHVREPQAELVASGRWQLEPRRLELPSATLTSGAVSAQATDVVCTFPQQGLPEFNFNNGISKRIYDYDVFITAARGGYY